MLHPRSFLYILHFLLLLFYVAQLFFSSSYYRVFCLFPVCLCRFTLPFTQSISPQINVVDRISLDRLLFCFIHSIRRSGSFIIVLPEYLLAAFHHGSFYFCFRLVLPLSPLLPRRVDQKTHAHLLSLSPIDITAVIFRFLFHVIIRSCIRCVFHININYWISVGIKWQRVCILLQ